MVWVLESVPVKSLRSNIRSNGNISESSEENQLSQEHDNNQAPQPPAFQQILTFKNDQ